VERGEVNHQTFRQSVVIASQNPVKISISMAAGGQGKGPFSQGGTLHGQNFGLNVPRIHQAVHTACNGFEIWH